jgi:2'-5' RNA ligase
VTSVTTLDLSEQLLKGKGLWIGLLPKKDTFHNLALPSDAHITVAYYGKSKVLRDINNLDSTLRFHCQTWHRQTISFHATARFRSPPGQPEAIVLLARRNKVLNDMRRTLSGVEQDGEEWSPHITIRWVADKVPAPIESASNLPDISFDRMILSAGGISLEYPLVAGFVR